MAVVGDRRGRREKGREGVKERERESGREGERQRPGKGRESCLLPKDHGRVHHPGLLRRHQNMTQLPSEHLR